MRVKKFEAKSMKEALRMVKAELGPEAVILSARDNRKSFGLVGEGSVEVTAAVSDRTLQKKHFVESKMRETDRDRFAAAPASEQKRFIDKSVQKRVDEQARANAPRRPPTTTSYIDIMDDEDHYQQAAQRQPQSQSQRQPQEQPRQRTGGARAAVQAHAQAQAQAQIIAQAQANVRARQQAQRQAAAQVPPPARPNAHAGAYAAQAAGRPQPQGRGAAQAPLVAQQTAARSLAASAGRSVAELLNEYDATFESEDLAPIGPSPRVQAAAQAAARAAQATALPAAKETAMEAGGGPQPGPRSARALSHIQTAAREAWNSGLMGGEEERSHKGRVIGAFGKLLPGNRTQTAASKRDQAHASSLDMDPEDTFAAVPLARARAVADQGRASAMAPIPARRNDASAASGHSPIEIESLRVEIQRLQEMIGGIQRGAGGSVGGMHPGADFGVPFDLSRMYQKLTDAGVGAENAAELLQQCQREMDPIRLKRQPLVDAWVARYLLDRVDVVQDPYRGRVHLFLGGAGSGKTSTLVKMASHLVVKEKRRVAVVTTDVQKVGAVDQLKIYCQILNVPLAIVRNKTEWDWALSQLQGFDCILADFPGLQLRDMEEIDRLKSLLPPETAQAVAHLTINSTSKDGDAIEIERRYRLASFNDLIFTNVDQSSQHGLIYNVQKRAQKPIHSFGVGNRIPEDFEIATKERVLDLIFKLSQHRTQSPNGEAV